jgi:hypothetical protein
LSLCAGCRNCDLVEAELRTRDNEVRELRAELAHMECQNEALMQEIGALRQGTSAKFSPELAPQAYPLKQIVLGRSTGGHDEDDSPGDEALQVAVEPRDADGHTIKALGALHVEALEINPAGLKTPLCSWDLTPEQFCRTWHSGLFSTGYLVILPWKQWPSSEKLRVIARFSSLDCRVLEADKDVTIRLTPPAKRKVMPLAIPSEEQGLALPDKEELLPPPRKEAPKEAPSTKAWWLTPPGKPTPPVEAAVQWRPKEDPSLVESVQLLRPTPLERAGE